MRGLFSMLFGAGVILLTSRAERRGSTNVAADIYTRRNLLLLFFASFTHVSSGMETSSSTTAFKRSSFSIPPATSRQRRSSGSAPYSLWFLRPLARSCSSGTSGLLSER